MLAMTLPDFSRGFFDWDIDQFFVDLGFYPRAISMFGDDPRDKPSSSRKELKVDLPDFPGVLPSLQLLKLPDALDPAQCDGDGFSDHSSSFS